ncbi:unnamed protein product [Alopecurus aequalis]
MADQRRCHHRMQSQGIGDTEDGRGTAELRQETGCCGGVARSSTAENKTRTILLVVLVIGLCSFFFLLGTWQTKHYGRGDCIAAMVNEQTKCVVLKDLHGETHLALSGTPSWR